ncbi:MAG TPA: PQQ-dependent sugar dehydrogenase, partial [Anaerolineales bacterium]|nr:PQQ-dependent sugar dehydrogenase [Anaerolineales bacterium]
MRRFILLLILPLLACTGPGTSVPPTPTIVSTTPTAVSPTTIPDTSTPAEPTATATASGAATFPDPNAYQWQLFAGGLQRPVDLQADGSGRLFFIEKTGRIRIFQSGQLLDQPFLDITDRVGSSGNEQGLLGLAFHPGYAQNGRFFVNYTDTNGNTVIARFQVSSDASRADPNSEVKLLGIDQPFPNHNGG